MNLKTKADERLVASSTTARTLLRHSRVQLGLGAIGLGVAAVLIYPKVGALLSDGLEALGAGAIANLVLAFGSLMFLRNAQKLRTRAAATLRSNGEL